MTDSMTRKQALAEAIASIKAGHFPLHQLHNILGEHWNNARLAFHGSLDAAIALHDAVLPSSYWAIDSEHETVCVFDHLMKNAQVANGPIISRAWLLAILEALHAQETEE